MNLCVVYSLLLIQAMRMSLDQVSRSLVFLVSVEDKKPEPLDGAEFFVSEYAQLHPLSSAYDDAHLHF